MSGLKRLTTREKKLLNAIPHLVDSLKDCLQSAENEMNNMLCQAGAYSPAALEKAKSTWYWKRTMARVDNAKAAIAMVEGE